MFFTTLIALLLQDQIGYICVCPLLDTLYEYYIMYTIFCHFNLSVFLCEEIKLLYCSEWKHFCQDLNPRSSSTVKS